MTLEDNYRQVVRRFEAACERAGKVPGEDVTLVAVSKTFPASDILTVYGFGQRDFGENYAQEVVEKYPELPKNARVHYIGRLQRNKVKYIIDKTWMIHSCDSLALAQEISKQALKHDLIMPVMLEVNLAEQESKAGFSAEEIYDGFRQIGALPGIRVVGLMTIGPYEPEPEATRPLFRSMKKLFEEIKAMNIPGVEMRFLSMGMSHDFEVAIEEGANMVRVGSSIFGHRNYAK